MSEEFPFPGSDLANTPEQKARQIINFAQDSEVVAMWAVSGGESAPEVAKLLVEYGLNPAKYIEEHQVDFLSGQKLSYAIGGGLDSSLRTSWQPNFLPGSVLMVEDVSGYQTLSQRLLEARNCGALENVQAIIIGNATGAGSKLGDGVPGEIKALADEIGLPVFLIPDNQFRHLKDKEPTPIANFGIIEIDIAAKTATVSGENSHDLAKSYQQQNSGKLKKAKAASQETQAGDVIDHEVSVFLWLIKIVCQKK